MKLCSTIKLYQKKTMVSTKTVIFPKKRHMLHFFDIDAYAIINNNEKITIIFSDGDEILLT